MCYRRKLLAAALTIVSFAGLTWAGCTVDDSAVETGEFPCQSDDDCIQGFECIDGVCATGPNEYPTQCDQAPGPDPDYDIDLDDDGYGTGDDRRSCDEGKRAEDCDDTDPERNPGQAELCDGKDNDCDGQVDNFGCDVSTDCGSPPAALSSYLRYTCKNNECVMIPSRQLTTTCEEIEVTCDSTAQQFNYTVDSQTYAADEGPVVDECN